MLVLLVLGALGGLAVGVARGGRWSGLAAMPLHHRWLVLGAALAQAGTALAPDRGVGVGLLALSAVLAASFTFGNPGTPGLGLVLVGLLLNVAAVTANSGRMPVSLAALHRVHRDASALDGDHLHVLSGPATRLRPVTDWVPFATPVHRLSAVGSPGDLLVVAGLAVLVEAGTSGLPRRPRAA